MASRTTILLTIVAALTVPLARADEPSPIQLRATVEKARYCGSSDDEIFTLQIELRLHYRNVGKDPVILSRGVSLIPEAVVGKGQNGGAISEKEFSWEATIVTGGLEPPFSDAWPNRFYVRLLTGETFDTHGMGAVVIEPGKLGPGLHFLQFWAGASRGSAALEDKLRKAWQSKGYLWTKSVRSGPVPFTVAAHPKFRKCD